MIPKTTYHTEVPDYPHSIAHAFYEDTNEIDFLYLDLNDDASIYSDDVNAIFRIYPKGQNPLNIKRNERI